MLCSVGFGQTAVFAAQLAGYLNQNQNQYVGFSWWGASLSGEELPVRRSAFGSRMRSPACVLFFLLVCIIMVQGILPELS